MKKNKSALQILTGALALVEKGWTRHTSARDKNGDLCAYDSRRAVCWCASGAVNRSSGIDSRKIANPNKPASYYAAREYLMKATGTYFSLTGYNDYNIRDHRDAVRVVHPRH